MKSQLMKLANALRKSGLSLSASLKRAWAAIRLNRSLTRSDEKGVWVDFVKVDGTTRHILATRNPVHIPATEQPKQTGKPLSLLTLAFYDLFEGAWKCARVDRLILD